MKDYVEDMKAGTFFGVCAAVAGTIIYQHPPSGEFSIPGLLALVAMGMFAFWLQSPSRDPAIGSVGNAIDSQSPGERVLFRLGKFFNRLAK